MVIAPPDKWMHYAVCLTGAVLLGVISWWIGLIAILSIGFFKELLDSMSTSNYFSWGDFAADVAGAIVGTIPWFVTSLL